MRAMSENADSARLSGVWVRRTSTVTWTLAGVLSAFTAILAAPGQTSALTEVLSPDLLLLALTAALVGAMVNLTVAFVAGDRRGRVPRDPGVEPAVARPGQTWSLFALVLVVLLVRVARPAQGARARRSARPGRGRRAATVRADSRPLRRRVAVPGSWLAVVVAAAPALWCSTSAATFLLTQICIYAVIALSLTVLTGWAGQVSLGPVRPGGRAAR